MCDLRKAVDEARRMSEIWCVPHVVARRRGTAEIVVLSRDHWGGLLSHREYFEPIFVWKSLITKLERRGNGRYAEFATVI